MDDMEIIKLFFARSDSAVGELDGKYGRLCRHIAGNILHSSEDTEECVSDTYLTAWNTIPPKEPLPLFPYIGAILRNHAFNRYSYNHAAKRCCACREIESEIESLSCGDDIGDSIDSGIITECINRLLRAADEVNRMLFVRRYWYCDGLSELSRITCRDMITLCRYAMGFPLFREIVGSTSGALPISNMRTAPRRYRTTNRVMDPRSESAYMTDFTESVVGIKTGYIQAAGSNLACCVEKDGRVFYSVVMHCHDVPRGDRSLSGHFLDTITLMNYALQFYPTSYTPGFPIASAATKGSLKDNVQIGVAQPIGALSPQALEPQLSLSLGARVKKGDVVGTLTLDSGLELPEGLSSVKEVELIALNDASTSLLIYILRAVLGTALVLFLVLRGRRPAKPQI